MVNPISPPIVTVNLSPTEFRKNYTNNIKCQVKSELQDKEWLFDDALGLIGFGRVQYGLIFLCGLMLMSMINETMGMMMLTTPAQCDLNLTTFDKGLLTISGYIGILLPSYMWGYLCDQKGRRKIMIYTLFLTSVAAIGSSFAPNFICFIIFRFFAGFFVCASVGGVYPYLGEFMTQKNRPVVMAWCSLFIGLAMIYISVTAWMVVSMDFDFPIYGEFSFRPWRLIPILFTLPGLTAAVLLIFFKESPRYYLAQGREDKTLEVLYWIWEKNTKLDISTYPVRKLISEAHPKQIDAVAKSLLSTVWHQTVPLFRKPHVGYFLIICFMQFSVFASSGGLGLWFTEVQNRISNMVNVEGSICKILEKKPEISRNFTLHDNKLHEVCDDTVSSTAFIQTIGVGIYYSVGFLLISLFMNSVGRKWIIAFCLFTSSLSGILLHFATHQLLQVFLFASYIVLSGLMVSVISGGAVMLFPTQLRAMAVCIILMVARIGTSIGSTTVGATIETHCDATLAVITSMLIISGILNFYIPSN